MLHRMYIRYVQCAYNVATAHAATVSLDLFVHSVTASFSDLLPFLGFLVIRYEYVCLFLVEHLKVHVYEHKHIGRGRGSCLSENRPNRRSYFF